LSWTYTRTGVDIKKIKRAQNKIGAIIEKTRNYGNNKLGRVLGKFGHYASLIDIGNGKALAFHSDGCGTKVLISQLMRKFDTIGIDCVAMCVNDLLCMGVEPMVLLDYLAIERTDEKIITEIMKGLAKGAEEARVAILGGETAVMPDVIKGAVPGLGFDLAALGAGMVNIDKIIDGSKIRVGDAIIGLESSGIHSNGFTLARKVLMEAAGLKIYKFVDEFDKTLGEELLTPTKIYVQEILSVVSNYEVHGIAHITGGAFSKLKRFEDYSEVGFLLEELPTPKPIFRLIQEKGKISDEEMFNTFNMGVGICIIAPKDCYEDIISHCEKIGTRSFLVGEITQESGVRIEIENRTLKI
jgi:phosphoribosylformylglycinamidine cyclo-ligase